MEQNRYLSGEYQKEHPDYHVEDSPWKAQQVLKMMARHQLGPRTVCEVGCGAGEILGQLQAALPQNTEFCGYDISPHAGELWQARENENLRFFCQDLLDADTKPFDLLLCMDVFEHVEDYMGFLRRLRPKAGLKLFHIPLDMWTFSVLFSTPIEDCRKRFGHLHYFSKDTALATLVDTGYQIEDWFYTPTAIDRGSGLVATLGNVPRRFLSLVSPDLTVRLLGGYGLMVLAK